MITLLLISIIHTNRYCLFWFLLLQCYCCLLLVLFTLVLFSFDVVYFVILLSFTCFLHHFGVVHLIIVCFIVKQFCVVHYVIRCLCCCSLYQGCSLFVMKFILLLFILVLFYSLVLFTQLLISV